MVCFPVVAENLEERRVGRRNEFFNRYLKKLFINGGEKRVMLVQIWTRGKNPNCIYGRKYATLKRSCNSRAVYASAAVNLSRIAGPLAGNITAFVQSIHDTVGEQSPKLGHGREVISDRFKF